MAGDVIPRRVALRREEVVRRNNVWVGGNPTGRPTMFAHGFGCDQNMWRLVTPAFTDRYRIVLFDHVGAGGSDLSAYEPDRYARLDGYAEDVTEICQASQLRDVVFVGHSVASMIVVLAAVATLKRFGALVLVGPSPRYINDEDYIGGFTDAGIEARLAALDSNYLGWASTMAPVIMGNADRPELGAELTASFCRTDPDIQKRFARVTFRSDNRADLALVAVPALVLQCSADAIAPESVGRFVAARLPHGRFVQLRATGHCPSLSAPAETVEAITAFLAELP